MPKKAKAVAGEVVYISKEVNKEPASVPVNEPPVPSILSEPPKIDVPPVSDTTAPPPPPPSEPTVKGKRVYRKKNPQYWEAMSKSRKEMLMPKPKETKNEVVYPEEPKEPEKPVKTPRKKSVRIAPVIKPKPIKPVKEVKAKQPKKKPVVYDSSTEEEEEEDYEDSSSDDEVVERVAQKAHKRISTLQKIDKRINELKNPYSSTGRFSVF
jgi:hypothetical protein